MLTPTCSRFVQSEADVALLCGPRGEGKSVAGVVALLHHAERAFPERGQLRAAIVRDTWTNLERTVLETLHEGARWGWWEVELQNQGTEALLNGGLVKAYLLGMDRPADANKFQGLELGYVWLEEPAPAADFSSGVPLDVFAMAVSSLRQQGVPGRVRITMNPPDADHWTMRLGQEIPQGAPLSVETHWIPPGENPHVPEGYRERMRAAFERAGRPDLIQRLVEGQPGALTLGEAVVPPFSALHVATGPLPVYPQLTVFRFWDGGTPNLHPACVWAQALPARRASAYGALNVLGSRTGTNVGMVEFIQQEVLPFQQAYGLVARRSDRSAEPWGRGRIAGGYAFRDIGDPACLIPEGTSSQRTVALEIERALGAAFEPGPQDWTARREALLAAFGRAGEGDRPRLVQIDPQENDLLVKALRGRFHYPKDAATGRIRGTVQAAKAASGIFSHSVDALAYGLAVLFPAEETFQRRPAPTPRRPPVPEPRSWIGG